jgi:hypothetical protein
MKVFQIKDNKPPQILDSPTRTIKGLQNNGTIRAIEHVFVWGITYEQRVAIVKIRINILENIKVFMENWLVRFIR